MDHKHLYHPEAPKANVARIAAASIVLIILGLIFFTLALSAGGDTLVGSKNSGVCGVERVDIKQLKDSQGLEVASGIPRLTTVAAMLKLPLYTKRGLLLDESTRLAPTETTVYEIHALLIGFKKETDQDIHIVIADPGNTKQTMIAEIPAGYCMPPTLVAKYNGLQADFERDFGHATDKFKTLPKPVRFDVRGVGFFDFVHGQTGHAPNGIELHPVLGFITNK